MPSTQPPGQPHPYPTNQPTIEDGKCCGVVQEVAVVARERREMRKPQPWMVIKMVIPLVFGIMGFAAYAYVSRICLPMIDRTKPTVGSQAIGIVLLVIFVILFLWLVWAYLKVILTSPGYANEFTQQSERPLFPPGHPPRDDTRPSIASHEDNEGPDSNHAQKPSISGTTSSSHAAAYLRQQQLDHPAGPSYEEQSRPEVEAVHPTSTSPQPAEPASDANPKSPLPLPAHAENQASPVSTMSSTAVTPSNRPSEQTTTFQSNYAMRRERRRASEREKKSRNLYRKAPSTPVLSPVLRYCDIDRFIKPYRAHHCKACGTCVLKYDHHCPWIGGCVGARNHKFFINFCFVTSIFTAFVFATVLPFMLKAMRSKDVDAFDPRLIVLLALAGVFFMFTTLLFVSHVNMISQGQTTVESMSIRGMKERDQHVLARGFEWWEVRDKKRAWDEEWGNLDTEGNIWWRGNAYEEWVDVMGKDWLGWIFPIGRGMSDGSFYPVNPRFDAEGRMRRRSEWPEALR